MHVAFRHSTHLGPLILDERYLWPIIIQDNRSGKLSHFRVHITVKILEDERNTREHPVATNFYAGETDGRRWNAARTWPCTRRSQATRFTRRETSTRIALSFEWRMQWRYAKTRASRGVGAADPRNHLSVPRRSDREDIASRYCRATAVRSTWVP